MNGDLLEPANWIWGLSLITLTIAIHATGVVVLAVVSLRLRVRIAGSVTDLDLSISTSRIESNLQTRMSISGTLSLHARLSTVGIGKEALCIKR